MAKTILIVEDDPLTQRLYAELLAAHGYETLVTGDAAEALGLAQQHRPDMVLMDIQLQLGSGIDVTRRIRRDAELRNTPIVAVTALAMKGDADRMLAAGCDAYIAKPFSISLLLDTVRNFAGDDVNAAG